MTAVTTIVNRSTKLYRVENLVYWPYSSDFTAITATHHAAMM
jgi:hypothetical protein